MALLDGKQLRNQSTELGKLSGSGIVSFTAATMSFTAGSVLTTATANIVNPTDVVNKEYVDSVAAGLDPKQSVAYTTTGNITLSGTSTQSNGDWSESLTDGDRILVKNQTDKTENGIYVADSGSWSRAEDHDGTPANEVTLGNFTFVEYGTLAGSGFVLHATDSTNTPIITPGTDVQEWTLYSQAGAYTAGTGLNLTDGEFEIDVTGVGAGSYGSADSTTTFTVNSEGQLTAAADTQISIVASQVTDFDAAAETAIFEDPNFVDGTTIEFNVTAGDSVTAEVSDSSLTSAKLDTGSNGGATAGYVLSVDNNGDFKWKLDEGDISSIDAGNGLIGGGTAGDIQLNLGGTVSSDIIFNFTNSANLSLGSFGGNEIESFSTHAHEILVMGHKANGIPTGSLGITEGGTVLAGDVVDGYVTVMGNTASISASTDVSIVAATGKLDMSSPEINVGLGSTTDLKLKGDYTTIEGSTLDVTTNFVSIDSGTGPSQFLSGTDTTISASSSLNLTAGDSVAINGPSGSVLGMDVSGTSLVSHNGSGTLDLVGGNVTLEGSAHTQVNGSTINVVGSGDVNLVGGGGNVLTLGTSSNTFADNLNSKGIEYAADYSSNFTDNSLVTKKYVDSLDAAQITGVSAGNGLIGGGTAGDVTLNLGGVVNDDITFDFGASASIKFGSAGPGQYADSIGASAKSYFFMQHKDNGMPSGSLGLLQNSTSLFSDVFDGTTMIGGATVSLGGTNATITGADSVVISGPSSSSINMGTGGDVTLMTAPTGNATIASALGNVMVTSAAGGVLVSSASGSVDVTSAVGNVNVTTNSGTASFGSGTNTLVVGPSSNTFADNLNSKGIEYAADYSSNFTDNSLVTKKYVDSLDAAQITGVDAGAGLSGGGTAGTVALSVNTDNGLSIDGDNVVLGGTLSQATTIAGDNNNIEFGTGASRINQFRINSIESIEEFTAPGAGVLNVNKNPGGFTSLFSDAAGQSQIQNTSGEAYVQVGKNGNTEKSDIILSGAYAQLSVMSPSTNNQLSGFIFDSNPGGQDHYLFVDSRTASAGIEYDADYSANFTDRSLVDKAYADTKVSGVTAGAGLSGGGADGDITLNADLTVDGGLTFSGAGDAGTIEVVVDNTTIQVVNGALSVVAGTSQPVYQSATCSVTTGNTGISLTSTPNDYSRIEVYVNGQLQNLTENTTGDCYFGQAGTVLTSLTSGDSLFWDSYNAGFELSATDVIKVHYQA